MPDLVSKCFQSWKDQNKDYRVVLLTEKNLEQHVEIEERILNNNDITIQAM